LEQEAIYELPTYGASVEAKTVDLSLYLPKFDVMGKADLKNGLMKLGITKVFDPLESDFTPLTKETDGIHVTKVEHCARVKIDEEGCEAAAYVYMPMDGLGAMEPPETVELVFDRPFAFVVTGRAEQPLFTAIVDQG
jgi:serpin B